MSQLVLPNAGEVMALKAYLNHTVQDENWVLKLFKNNYTPIETSVAGDFTEADFSGYVDIELAGASWTVTGGDPTSAAYAEQAFISDDDQTAQTIYGYYTVRATGGELGWAERFDTPQVIEANGDTIRVTPVITGKDEQD